MSSHRRRSPDDFNIRGVAKRGSSSPTAEDRPSISRRSRSPTREQYRRRSRSQAEHPSRTERSPSEEGEAEDSQPPSTTEDDAPPLPSGPPPDTVEDDGWDARLDPQSGAYYYVNRFTGLTQWENPRMPDDPYGYKAAAAAAAAAGETYSGAPGTEPSSAAPGTSSGPAAPASPPPGPYMGYNPKIHGDFDPNADYAKFHAPQQEEAQEAVASNADGLMDIYAQQGTFNRFTGAFQAGNKNPEFHNDENKSHRQMNHFFDVDRAANSHDGRSLKAERAQKKLSKAQVKAFNEQRKAKKEQKRREFLLN